MSETDVTIEDFDPDNPEHAQLLEAPPTTETHPDDDEEERR